MSVPIDLARLALGTAVLAFASWTDWRWRRAPNALWVFTAGAGLAFLVLDVALDPTRLRLQWPYLVAAPAFAALMWLAWRVGLVAGGADAKALMALAVLLPWPLELGPLPLAPSPLPGVFAVFGNSLLAFLCVPLGILAWNVAHGRLRLPHALLATPVPVDDLGRTHAWPMERAEAGRVRTVWFPQRRADDPEAAREALRAAGRTHVWATPKVPFMIPLLVGFVAAFVVGDALTWLLTAAMGV